MACTRAAFRDWRPLLAIGGACCVTVSDGEQALGFGAVFRARHRSSMARCSLSEVIAHIGRSMHFLVVQVTGSLGLLKRTGTLHAADSRPRRPRAGARELHGLKSEP